MKEKVKGKRVKGKRREADAATARDGTIAEVAMAAAKDNRSDGHRPPLQLTGAGPAPTTTEKGTVARSATATTEAATTAAAAAPKLTKSEAMREHWRKVRAGVVPNNHDKKRPPMRSVNPLLDLPEEERAKLFAWLRECPYDDAVQHILRDQGIDNATQAQLDDFFQFEAAQHWEKRIGRAAQEANALVQLVERSPVKFSSGILAALGQEAFRQIASGQVEPDAMGKLATLFLKARSDERADQMQELKREKLRHELQAQIDHALEKLTEEVDRHPVAREAFDALCKELAASMEEAL